MKTRLLLIMGIMSALMILLGLAGLYAMKSLHDGLQTGYQNRTLGLAHLSRIEQLLSSNRHAILTAQADTAPEKLKGSADNIERDRRFIDQLWIDFAAMPMSLQARTKSDEFTRLRIAYDHAVTLPAIEALQNSATGKIKEISQLADKLQAPISASMSSLHSMQLDTAKKEFEAADASYRTVRNLMFAALALGLVLAAVLAYFLVHIIYHQLGGEPAYAAQIARQIAEGDLDVSITPEVYDEASLLTSMQSLQSGLAKTVKDMRVDTANIGRTSRQILSSNMMLSSRAELQVNARKKASAAMKELSSSVRHHGEQARQAVQLADDTSELAAKRALAASGAVNTMTQIRHASDKIFDSVQVIDELAFQIDTLTLKATVEDASGSDTGQRLTEIAPEVRDLAQCVSCAVKEIKNILNESREKLDNGSRLISQSNAGTEQMLATMHRVSDLMTEINVSTRKQEAGIRQVTHAISDMDHASLKDAVMVGVATTAAKLLEQQATHLAQLSSGFKLSASSRSQTQLQVVSTEVQVEEAPKRPNLRLVRT
ncbi:methyl-accepting chemotaxis protein [Undibacterium pigrum]|uniref:methyl-accepting chemotaxis protein n=1 Tax=Undibacterium pigrum TaxID=401470 RepID=UPI001B885320|nr:methyl-accepting chemotaxis protein [Undibacterium pigrum]